MWEAFKDGIFFVIDFFFKICGDWGLSIIIITLIFRTALLPLMHKSTKSSYAMKAMNPKIQKIKEMYADDKMRQSQEMQKIYAEAKFNPLSGCIPMFIQMPIFMALFQVLREMSSRPEVESTNFCFYNIIPDLLKSPSDAWGSGFISSIPYLVLIIIFAGATFLPMIIQQQNNSDPKQRKQTLIMSGAMSIMMIFIGWGSPAGVLLFWGTSSVIAVIQQRISMKMFEKKEKLEEEKKEFQPVKVNVVRKERVKRPKKKK